MRKTETIMALALATALVFSGCLGGENDPETNETSADDEGPDNEMGAQVTGNETGMVIHETSATWTAGISGCPNTIYLAATDGVDSAWSALPSPAQGQPFNATFDSAAPAVAYGLTFSAGENFVDTIESSEPEVEGNVPSDAEDVIFWTCGGADVTVSFTVISG